MKMFLLRYSTAVLLVVFIASGAASGADVMKAVGDDEVSFRPDKPLPPPVSSICWKHINSTGVVVKAIEWDEDGLVIPNPRFQNITTFDENTGQITITKLKVEHSGVYIIEINSKAQEQRFTLTVKKRVPKPEIKIEPTDNPDVVYLRCEYSETIIWKNSTDHILKGSAITIGESLTVKKNGHPGNFYTCTLDNGVSKETSDPVYERNLFKGLGIGHEMITVIVAVIILLIIIIIVVILYKCNRKFKGKYTPASSNDERVDACCSCFKVYTVEQYTPEPSNNGTEKTGDKDKKESVALNPEGKKEEGEEKPMKLTSASVKEEKP